MPAAGCARPKAALSFWLRARRRAAVPAPKMYSHWPSSASRVRRRERRRRPEVGAACRYATSEHFSKRHERELSPPSWLGPAGALTFPTHSES